MSLLSRFNYVPLSCGWHRAPKPLYNLGPRDHARPDVGSKQVPQPSCCESLVLHEPRQGRRASEEPSDALMVASSMPKHMQRDKEASRKWMEGVAQKKEDWAEVRDSYEAKEGKSCWGWPEHVQASRGSGMVKGPRKRQVNSGRGFRVFGQTPECKQMVFLVQKGIWKSFYLKITFGQVSWGWKGGHSTVSFVYKACWWWFSQSVLWYYMISQIFTRSHRKVTKDKLYLGRFLLGSVAFPNEIEAQSSCDLEVIDPFHTAFSRYIDSSRRLFVKSICCCTYYSRMNLGPPLLSRVPIHQPAGEIFKEDLRCVCPTVERVLVAGFLTSSSLLQWLFMGFLLGRLGLKRYSFRRYLKLSLQRLRLGLRGPRIEFNLGLLHFPHFDLWRFGVRHKILAFRFSFGAISSAISHTERDLVIWLGPEAAALCCRVGMKVSAAMVLKVARALTGGHLVFKPQHHMLRDKTLPVLCTSRKTKSEQSRAKDRTCSKVAQRGRLN